MYDDYDLDYTYASDYSYDLDEYYAQECDLDEDYARDGQDYESLAYRHYAWYNLDTTHLSPRTRIWRSRSAKYVLRLISRVMMI